MRSNIYWGINSPSSSFPNVHDTVIGKIAETRTMQVPCLLVSSREVYFTTYTEKH